MKKLFTIFSAVFICFVQIQGANSFIKQPVLYPEGPSTWQVEFELAEYTDVAVSIVRLKDSTVVRHLAAGVLGSNAPAPLLRSSLSQKIAWDGIDDLGQTVADTSTLAVRVQAGMNVSLKTTVGDNPYTFEGKIMGLALDENNQVYIFGQYGNITRMGAHLTALRQYSSSGDYQKSIYPFPANLSMSQVLPYGIIPLAGDKYQLKTMEDVAPQFGDPSAMISYSSTMIMPSVSNGEVMLLSFPGLNFVKIGTNSEILSSGPVPLITSPPTPDISRYYGPWCGGPIYISLSPDNKYVLLSGYYQADYDSSGDNFFPSDTGFWRDGQVFKVDLTTGAATPWLSLNGDSLPKTETERAAIIGPRWRGHRNDMLRNAAIHGTAFDDSGRVFICNRLYKEVSVYDTGANYLGAISVPNADLVAVSRKTGEVYVVTRIISGYSGTVTGDVSIRKYSGWASNATLKASIVALTNQIGGGSGTILEPKVHMVLNQSGSNTIIWLSGRANGQCNVWAIRDDGDNLTVIKDFSVEYPNSNTGFDRIAVDRKREVVYLNNSWSGLYKVENWDQPGLVRCSTALKKPLHAASMEIDPANNFLYIREDRTFDGPLTRYTLSHYHAPAPFAGRGTNKVMDVVNRQGAGYADRGHAVSVDGRVAIMHRCGGYCVDMYDTNGTAIDRGIISPLSSECGGVEFDLAGNLYVGALTWSSGHAAPAGYEDDPSYRISVGSVVKFDSRNGGSIGDGSLGSSNNPSIRPVQGALQIYNRGYAPLSGEPSGECVCRSPRFDLDYYGRLFIPNAITGKVSVVDNEDNEIVNFGEYGNIDSRGPGSLVPTGDIPMAWPVGVAVSEDYIYVSDMGNARILKVQMNYVLDNMPYLTTHVEKSRYSAAGSGYRLTCTPNPFNPAGVLRVNLPEKSLIKLSIYSISGRLVKQISEKRAGKGQHTFTWGGVNQYGNRVPSGLYYARLQAGRQVILAKLVLVK